MARRKIPRNPFSTAFDSAIIANEMTGDEAAKAINVTPGAITRWRSGDQIPTDEKYLRPISEVFDLDFEQLCIDAFTSKFPFLKSMFDKRPAQKPLMESLSPEERNAITKTLAIIRHAKYGTKVIFLDILEATYKRFNQTNNRRWLQVTGYPSTYRNSKEG